MRDTIEHKNTDGSVVRIHPSKWEAKWHLHSQGTTMSYRENVLAAAGLLNKPFVFSTLSQRKRSVLEGGTLISDGTMIQLGIKNTIFGIDVGGDTFVLVVSKGTEKLKKGVEAEFDNLKKLREALYRRGLPMFVPQVYELARGDIVSGFSFEYLPDHAELRQNAVFGGPRQYSFFVMNTDDLPGARAYNEKIDVQQLQRWMKGEPTDDPNARIKTEIIARLYIVHQLTSSVPKEFAINAGDFMADPTKEDFDLRLITVRGGWERIRDLEAWLFKHSIPGEFTLGERTSTVDCFTFDRNNRLIEAGLQRGKQLYSGSKR